MKVKISIKESENYTAIATFVDVDDTATLADVWDDIASMINKPFEIISIERGEK